MKWKVIWSDPASGKKRLKRFEDTKEAVTFAKELREEVDKDSIHVVSAVHAYPIPKRYKKDGQENPKHDRPSPRHLWCPYCIEWRIFIVSAVRFDGLLSPEARRCPVCTVSVEDYHVKKLNHTLGVVEEEKLLKGMSGVFRRGG